MEDRADGAVGPGLREIAADRDSVFAITPAAVIYY